ncbi:hypothetical protein Glove_304g10 [Diversispora epigaea]|uniref:BED-type domain-containing protein n=1 Tax=Diversispora epigaea TaxID=1348612 RepID=A0A397I0M4_9GLOM|nr:hypothetical protein Glove_304g10 [Diversispora epigaea]
MDREELQTITSQQEGQYDNDNNFNNDNDDDFNNDNDDNFNNDNDDNFNNYNDNDDNFNNENNDSYNDDNNDNNDNQKDNLSENRVIEKSQKESNSIQTSSQVWDHFKKASDFKKSKNAVCKYCGCSYVCSGGSTSNLLKHLKKKHPMQAIQAGISKQVTTIDEMFSQPKVDIFYNDDNNDNNDNQKDNLSENRVIEKSQKESNSIQTSSQVWDHFKKASDFKKSKNAVCKYCGCSYVCSGGSTSNLLKHLKKKHPMQAIQAGISKQVTTIDEMFSQPKEKLSPIEQFISIQELYIKDCDCYSLCKSDCLSLVLSFTQLSRCCKGGGGNKEIIVKRTSATIFIK